MSEIRQLPVALTPDEIAARADELAKLIHRIALVENERKGAQEKFKEEL
jgi:hypothetical protein